MTDVLNPTAGLEPGPSEDDLCAIKERIEADEKIGEYPLELIDELGSTVVGVWDKYLDHRLAPTEQSRRQLVSAQVAANRLLGATARYHIERQATESLVAIGEYQTEAEEPQVQRLIASSDEYRPDRRRRNWYF